MTLIIKRHRIRRILYLCTYFLSVFTFISCNTDNNKHGGDEEEERVTVEVFYEEKYDRSIRFSSSLVAYSDTMYVLEIAQDSIDPVSNFLSTMIPLNVRITNSNFDTIKAGFVNVHSSSILNGKGEYNLMYYPSVNNYVKDGKLYIFHKSVKGNYIEPLESKK